jgi:glycine hydroxymethyltransferase
MAHFAGLVAGKVFRDEFSPIPFAQVVTTTTHKTLRGPRGGAVFCTKEFAEYVDKGCPMVLGGPLPHVMAAKGVAFTEANRPEFHDYAQAIVDNARALAEGCCAEGMTVPTGGTDNHLLLIDVRPFGLTGRQAESAVRRSGITLNRNSLPFDPNGPWYTSGLRVGTPAVTSLGMGPAEMKEIASVLKLILSHTVADEAKGDDRPAGRSKAKFTVHPPAEDEARTRLDTLLAKFPVYPQLDLAILQRHFG